VLYHKDTEQKNKKERRIKINPNLFGIDFMMTPAAFARSDSSESSEEALALSIFPSLTVLVPCFCRQSEGQVLVSCFR
jgi:hypothetical protein